MLYLILGIVVGAGAVYLVYRERTKALQAMALKSMMAKKQRERAKQAAVNPSLQSR